MSWIFATSISSASNLNPVPTPPGTPLFTLSTPTLSLYIGGNPDTSFWECDEQKSTGWAVVGVGIASGDSRPSILTRKEWSRSLNQDSFDPNSLDGHFVIIRWKSDMLECFVDQLGLRTMFFGACDHGICISTRLDWVARTRKSSEINFSSLGSRWLLFNQLSYDSNVVGVERLGPGGNATFKSGSVIRFMATRPWLPSFEPVDTGLLVRCLEGLVSCALDYPGGASLGLSGGLDSRLLLALCTSNAGKAFAMHTFGESADPDVEVSGHIASYLGTRYYRFNEEIPDAETCVQWIESFVSQTDLTEPCTSYLKLRYYSKLNSFCRLMVDGGFGEFGRRQYLNRVVRFGRRALRTRDVSCLRQLFGVHRADVFSEEINKLLDEGTRQSLEKMFDEMPSVDEIGVENFVDLLTLRNRVPNYGAPAQAKVDGELLNFMPFVQPSYLKTVFGLPLCLRNNGKLFYQLIRSRNSSLERFPLVKAGYTYRFGLPTNLVWLTTKIKSKMRGPYLDSGPNILLNRLRVYILDLAHSRDVSANSIYDSRRIIDAVTKYYRGELRLVNYIEWWLTFELWRQSLGQGE